MITWDRHGDRMVLVFSPRQIRWLRQHLTQYQRMIDRAKPADAMNCVQPASHVRPDPTETIQISPARQRASISNVISGLPNRGGVVIVDKPDRLPWAWTLQGLRQLVVLRLKGLRSDDARVTSAAAGLKSWLDEVIAQLTADDAVHSGYQQQLSELSRSVRWEN